VALRLVVEREVEIEAFKPQEYWSVTAQLMTPRHEKFMGRLETKSSRR
jgi:DNA topoisomerase-1